MSPHVLVPLAVNSKSERKVTSLPPLGFKPVIFGMLAHLSDRSAKSHPQLILSNSVSTWEARWGAMGSCRLNSLTDTWVTYIIAWDESQPVTLFHLLLALHTVRCGHWQVVHKAGTQQQGNSIQFLDSNIYMPRKTNNMDNNSKQRNVYTTTV
jgi:hypothetical protein